MPGTAFVGNPVIPFIKRWVRECCVLGVDRWSSLVDLRGSYESYCDRMGKSQEFKRHDIMPTLEKMGCKLRYGSDPAVYGVTLREKPGQ